MVNVDRLKAVMALVEYEAANDLHEQNAWMEVQNWDTLAALPIGEVDPLLTDCGTAFCFCGWATAASTEYRSEIVKSWDEHKLRLIEIATGDYTDGGSWYTSDTSDIPRTDDGAYRDWTVRGRELLDLSYVDAMILFDGANSIEEIRLMVMDLIVHNELQGGRSYYVDRAGTDDD